MDSQQYNNNNNNNNNNLPNLNLNNKNDDSEMFESWTIFDNYFNDNNKQLGNDYNGSSRTINTEFTLPNLKNAIVSNDGNTHYINNSFTNNIRTVNDGLKLIDIEILTNSSIDNELNDYDDLSDEISIISESDHNEKLYNLTPSPELSPSPPPMTSSPSTSSTVKKYFNKNDLNKQENNILGTMSNTGTSGTEQTSTLSIQKNSDIDNNCRKKLIDDNTTEIVRKKPKLNLCPIINVKKLLKNLPMKNNEKINFFTKLNKNLLYFGFLTGIIGIFMGSYLTTSSLKIDNNSIKEDQPVIDETFIKMIKDLEYENEILINQIKVLHNEISQLRSFYNYDDAISFNNKKRNEWVAGEEPIQMPIIVKESQEQEIIDNDDDQLLQETSDFLENMIEVTSEYDEQSQHTNHDSLKIAKIIETDKQNKTGDEKLEINGSNRIKLSKRKRSVAGTETEKQGNDKKKTTASRRSKLKRQGNVVSNELDDSSSSDDSMLSDKEDEVPQYKELNRKRDKQSHKPKKEDRKNRFKNIKANKKYPQSDIVDMEFSLSGIEEEENSGDNEERPFEGENYYKCDYCKVEKRKPQKLRKKQATKETKENIVKKVKRTLDFDDEQLAYDQNKILEQMWKDKLPKLDIEAINKEYIEMNKIDWHDRLMKSREELRSIENSERKKKLPLSNWYIRRANDRENLRFHIDNKNFNKKK